MLKTSFLMRIRLKKSKGQAAIETAFALPILIYLLYYMVNAFLTLHSATIAETYSNAETYRRISHRSQFKVDSVDLRPGLTKQFIATQYRAVDGSLPSRGILNQSRLQIESTIGVCREPGCN